MKATHAERENWRTQEDSTEFWYSKLNETEQFVIRFTAVVAVVFTIAYFVANIDVLEIVQVINDFAANVITEVISIAVTVLVIERLNQRRATKQQRDELILQMGHPSDNGIAREAVRKLRHYKWLIDGSLQEAKLVSANLQEAMLVSANLQEAKLVSANLQEAKLVSANLQEADLRGANLQEADLRSANLQEAKLVSANLQEAKLVRANLQEAKLVRANLQEADLRYANLQEAKLGGANLQEAKLGEANLQEADLRGVKYIDTAYFNINTILPNGVKWHQRCDLTIFTNPEHPYFWESEWVKEQRELADG